MSITGQDVVAIVLKEWHAIHPEVDHVRNGQCGNCNLFVSWFKAHPTLPVNFVNMNAAYAELRNQMQILKSPAEQERERIEAIRTQIYQTVSERLAPAQINFQDPRVILAIGDWLRANNGGQQDVESTYQAVKALRFELPWIHEPEGLAKNRRNETFGYDDSRETAPQGRRNHAFDTINKESDEKVAAAKKRMANDEGQVMGEAVEAAIRGYQAYVNGRFSYGTTETIQNLLRKYAARRGNDVLRLLREMPDDATQAASWLLKRM